MAGKRETTEPEAPEAAPVVEDPWQDARDEGPVAQRGGGGLQRLLELAGQQDAKQEDHLAALRQTLEPVARRASELAQELRQLEALYSPRLDALAKVPWAKIVAHDPPATFRWMLSALKDARAIIQEIPRLENMSAAIGRLDDSYGRNTSLFRAQSLHASISIASEYPQRLTELVNQAERQAGELEKWASRRLGMEG